MFKQNEERTMSSRLKNNCLSENESIVISGISGRFPESDNMHELRDQLFDKTELITHDERKLPKGLYNIPDGLGKIKHLENFDSEFFQMPERLAKVVDPSIRILLEVVYEAIVDAGLQPDTLKGSRTGVFCGNCFSETIDSMCCTEEDAGYTLIGNSRAFLANQVTSYFDFVGPTYTVDSGCSSAFSCFDNAVEYIQTGVIDQAIVCSANIILRPLASVHFQRLGMLSPEAKCKTFDASANGYARAEGICAMFVQRSSMAKRLYYTMVHLNTNSDGHTIEGITFPSYKMQCQLVTTTFKECGINPLDVAYVEAHGTGTTVGDHQEVNAIADVFCPGRETPMLLGSVKSNMGHTEASAALCQVAKVIIASETGLIPPNLYFDNPNPGVPGLLDGSLKVVTECTPWDGGIVAINSFGFGGTNTHVILKSNDKIKTKKFDKIPKLFAISGRTEEAVDVFLSTLHKDPDLELLGLLSDLIDKPSPRHYYRGYIVLHDLRAEKTIRKVSPNQRPLWYVFPGTGSQWVGMARDMMSIKSFKDSMLRSYDILKSHNINLMKLIKTTEEEEFNSKIVNACVCITSVQIALLDCLSTMGLAPDGVVGCSIGEIACAYADGCLTAEQALLVAYWIGYCVDTSNLANGAMADVGISAEVALKRFTGITAAAYLANNIITITGPTDIVKKTTEKLQSQKMYVKMLKTCGKALHSSSLDKITTNLMKHLDKVIPNPKHRSHHWISTAFSQPKQTSRVAQTASSAYFANNIINSVYLCDALKHIPKEAIIIEVGPDSVLKSSIINAERLNNFRYLELASKDYSNQLCYFLDCLGQLYMTGYNFRVSGLYPTVEYPVSVGTPMISPLIKWDHSHPYPVASFETFKEANTVVACSISFTIKSITEELAHRMYLSHVIDGRVLFPATGYLAIAWEQLAKSKKLPFTELEVQFENVKYHRATLIYDGGDMTVCSALSKATGRFEIIEGNELVVSGYIYDMNECEPLNISNVKCPVVNKSDDDFQLDAKDIYKEFRLRGYDYGPDFQGVVDANLNGQCGHLKWTGQWVTYLDSVLQFAVVGSHSRKLKVPTGINRLRINPTVMPKTEVKSLFIETHEVAPIEEIMNVWGDPDMNLLVADGVMVEGLSTTTISRSGQRIPPTLEEYNFIPYDENCCFANMPKLGRQLQEYGAVCSNIIQQGCFHLLKQNSEFLPDSELLLFVVKMVPPLSNYSSCTKENEFNTSFEKMLQDIFALPVDNDYQTNISELMKTESLMTDFLLTSLMHWRALKPCLDVAAENGGIGKMKVVEVDSSRCSAIKSVLQVFASPSVEIVYTLTESDEENLSTLKEAHAHTKCTKWNVETQQFVTPDNDLIVCINLFVHHQESISQCIKNIADSLKPGGFILFFEMIPNTIISCMLPFLWGYNTCVNETTFKDVLQNENLVIVSQKSDGILNNVFLVRKPLKEKPSYILPITLKYENWLETLKNKLANENDENLWLISEKEPLCGILGIINALRVEGNQAVRCVFNASLNDKNEFPELPAYDEIMKKDLVMNVYRNNVWGSFRYLPMFQDENDGLVMTDVSHIHYTHKGDFSSLRWFTTPSINMQPLFGNTAELVQVYYTGLNFRDILFTSGRITLDEFDTIGTDHVLGIEYAGRTESGKRIFGCVSCMGLATTVRAHPVYTWEIPEQFTMEEAVTLPIVYMTVCYSFFKRGRMQPGETVLIHSGSGGIGQAAINVALKLDCKVYVTVGSENKRKFLKKRFPQLLDEDISCSRDLSFEQHIMKMTNGKGVDLILNSLAEEKLQASVRCLAVNGRFLEIGKYDMLVDSDIEKKCFQKNGTYIGIVLDKLFKENTDEAQYIRNYFTEGLKSGLVQPLNHTVFNYTDVEDAFRFMATGKHMGKVVIKMREEEADLMAIPSPLFVPAIPVAECDANKSYIITGGIGGFGLELAYWLISKGALKITLNSRSEPRTGYQMACLKAWKYLGVDVQLSTDNIATQEGASSLIKTAISKQGPVGGIFHLAMVLKDALLENQTEENYQEVFTPKINGAMELDDASRQLCPDIKWFILFSSIVSGRGNVGQTNYAFANSTIERIVEKRHSQGLCGLAIQWGIIGDVGAAFELLGGNKPLIGGMMSQNINSCMSSLERLLMQSRPVVSCMVLAPKFGGGRGKNKQDVRDLFYKVFGLQKHEKLNPNLTLTEMGMDSLMGVEIKQVLQRDYNKELSVQEIRALTVQNVLDIANEAENN